MPNNGELRKLLDADDLPREAVPTPEWPDQDGRLFVRPPTFREFIASIQIDDPTARAAYTLLSCTVDADGKPVFTPGDQPKMLARNAEPAARLYNAIHRLSELGNKAIEARVKKDGVPANGGP